MKEVKLANFSGYKDFSKENKQGGAMLILIFPWEKWSVSSAIEVLFFFVSPAFILVRNGEV